MDWKKFFSNRKVLAGIGIVLVVAILIGLLVSSCDGKVAQLENPLGDMEDISDVQMGVTEPEETEPEETEPEETEPEETEPEETKPEETEPEEAEPEETEPEETEPDDTQTGDNDGDQGSEDGTLELELALELSWNKKDGSKGTLICAPDKPIEGAVENYELNNDVFAFSLKLTGENASDVKLTSAKYTNTSGESGTLSVAGGSITLKPKTGTNTQTYYLTFEGTAQTKDKAGTVRETAVTFGYTIVYTQTLDVQLSVKVDETNTSVECKNLGSVTTKVKNRQLSAGAVNFELKFTGEDALGARILSVAYTSESGKSGTLTSISGTANRYNLAMTMPEGDTSNAYTVTVKALVRGQNMQFTIHFDYSYDVTLELRYNNGFYRSITCENGKTRTAAEVYDDQLTDGMLPYSLSIVGSDANHVTITNVSLYQSGSGKQTTITKSGEVQLLLKDGLTGENSFRVTAEDDSNTYEFVINIPYKHKGTNSIAISTNMADGQTVTNEFDTNLSVSAWSPYADAYLPASSITVKLDGQTIAYASSGINAQEYTLCPANPEVGDTNTHTLYIYAEDAYGNYGSKTLTLNGRRAMTGQKKGTATICLDLSALGLGVESISCDVLVNEPISYTVYKAVTGSAVSSSMGKLGDLLGAPSAAFGYSLDYEGTLDSGFYLSGMTIGGTPNAMMEAPWPGTEEETLAAIDARFGEGTGLASLWRCIYRNGLNKNPGSTGMIYEADFTQGSGWMYSINGRFPGQAMSTQYLENGDVLTLHYTLAYGWDIGGGGGSYGNTVGYCVTARGGSIAVNHNIVENIDGDGVITYTCKHCGWEQECEHEYGWKYHENDNGTNNHIQYCTKCKKTFEETAEHTFASNGSDEKHTCTACGYEEGHQLSSKTTTTATCLQQGTKVTSCANCDYQKEEPVEGTHKISYKYAVDGDYTKHGEYCTVCKQWISTGNHYFVWDDFEEDFICRTGACQKSGVFHEWDLWCEGSRTIVAAMSTCKMKVELCDECGNYLYTPGTYEEYHHYENGTCIHCGGAAPCSHTNVTWVDVDDGTRKQQCSDCQQDMGVTCNHEGHWQQTGDTATCTEDGVLTKQCSVCQKQTTETSPAKGHSYSDGTCGSCGAADPNYVPPSGGGDGSGGDAGGEGGTDPYGENS